MSKPLSLSLPAQVLVELEQHAGTWVALSTLQARIAAPQGCLERICQDFARAGHIAYARLADEPYYGHCVEGVAPQLDVDRVAQAAAKAELGEAIRAVLLPLHVGMHAIAMRNDDALLRALRDAFARMPALEAPLRKYAALIQTAPEPIASAH